MQPEVRLDRLRAGDVAQIAQAMTDPDTFRWLASVPQPYGLDQARAFVANAGAFDYAIRVGDAFAGTVRGGDNLGYWVMPRFRGQGVAQRAALLALSRSFLAGQRSVSASCDQENAASLAVLNALGFADPRPGTVFVERLKAERPALRLSLSRQAFVHANPLVLRTRRLVLDQIQDDDLPALHRIATDPRVAPMLLRFYPGMTLAEFRELIPTDAAIPPFRLAIRCQGQLIGSIGIGEPGEAPHIFYFLTPDVWGKGMAGEVLPAFLKEIDARFAFPVLFAGVFADNPASARLLERNGFRITREEDVLSKGRAAPARGWAMLRQMEQA